jgi:hypothetical protein
MMMVMEKSVVVITVVEKLEVEEREFWVVCYSDGKGQNEEKCR